MTWNSAQNLVPSAEVKADSISAFSGDLVGTRVSLAVNVTVPPRSGTPMRIMVQESHDGSTWGVEKMAHQFTRVDAAGVYTATVDLKAPHNRVAIKPLMFKATFSVDGAIDS